MDYQQIGSRIKFLRKNQHITQAELAERADLSVPYISHVERAAKRVSLRSLVNIASALDVSLDQLVGNDRPTAWKGPVPEAEVLLEDCSPRERRILLDIAAAAKRSLRNHS